MTTLVLVAVGLFLLLQLGLALSGLFFELGKKQGTVLGPEENQK
jgi:hypothetical protein